MKYKLYKEINVFDDLKLLRQLNLLSILIFFVSVIIFGMIGHYQFNLLQAEFRVMTLVNSVLWGFGVIIIHEGIHGILFKVFKPGAEIQFGFKKGMAYAGSIGHRYSRIQMLITLSGPFIIITISLYLLALNEIMSPWLYTILSVWHTAACVGDFYFSYLIIQAPGKVIVEDTAEGIKIFHHHK